MKKYLLRISVLLGISLFSISLISSCDSNNGKKKENKNIVIKIKKDSIIKVNDKLNDIAMYLAGMTLNAKSELFDLTKVPEWIAYSKSSDSSWTKLKKKRTDRMKEWSKKEMPELIKNFNTLFYPFGGPDFIHANALFSTVKKYILFGLEPIGDVPNFKALKKEELGRYFSCINKSLEDIIRLSFFRTSDMSSDLISSKVNGTLPLILLFIARSGHQIVDVKPIEIDTTGKINYITAFKNYKSKKSYNYGAEVKFMLPNDSAFVKTLYYVSADVANKEITANKNILLFFEKLDTGLVAFIKSASYLMYNSNFSIIRNFILNKSKMILQDDSGIAYKYFNKNKWNFQYYGIYAGTITQFVKYYDEDFKKDFDKGKPKMFDFKYGYGHNSNMLIVRKK